MHGQSLWSWLLSHHPVEQRRLCYDLRLGKRKIYLCARCLGLFPAMFLSLLVGHVSGKWPWWLTWSLLFLAPLPALLDWGTQVASGKPERSNRLRLATGVGLGVAIGTSLHMQTYALLSYSAVAQFTFFLGSVWVVWLASFTRRNLARHNRLRLYRKQKPSLEEYLRQSMDEEPGALCETPVTGSAKPKLKS